MAGKTYGNTCGNSTSHQKWKFSCGEHVAIYILPIKTLWRSKFVLTIFVYFVASKIKLLSMHFLIVKIFNIGGMPIFHASVQFLYIVIWLIFFVGWWRRGGLKTSKSLLASLGALESEKLAITWKSFSTKSFWKSNFSSTEYPRQKQRECT